MRACPKCGHRADDDVIFCPKDGARLVGEEDSAELKVKPADPLIGATLADRYRIVRRIGEGGMGVVYEAEHVALGKHVALKVLREDFTRKSDLVERFKQEARSASIIGHENIIDVSDFGTIEGGGIFFAMELLRGEDLADVLQRETRLALPRAAHIVAQMCRALHAAHQKGIIHRDLKPENVFLVQKDERPDVVKVLDFGIAKMTNVDAEGRRLTQSGVIFGTPEYMAPEQARGQTLDHRVDIYATGVMLYEMLCGQVPFSGESFVAILTQQLFSEPRPLAAVNPQLHVPAAVEAVVRRAMAKDRDERYSTMMELLEDLQRAMAGDTADARSSTLPATGPQPLVRHRPNGSDGFSQPPAAVPARTRRRSRRTWLVALIALFVVAAAAAGAWALWIRGYFGGGPAADAGLIATADASHAAWAATGAGPGAPAEAGPARAPDASPDARESDVAPAAPDAGAAEAAPEAAAPETAADGLPALDAVAPDTAPATGPDAGTASGKVSVEIDSEPSGARLYDGRGKLLCTRTPCGIDASVGTVLLLHAEKDPDWTGDDRFPVRAGTRRLSVTLRRPIAPHRDGGGIAAPADVSPFHLRQPDGLTVH